MNYKLVKLFYNNFRICALIICEANLWPQWRNLWQRVAFSYVTCTTSKNLSVYSNLEKSVVLLWNIVKHFFTLNNVCITSTTAYWKMYFLGIVGSIVLPHVIVFLNFFFRYNIVELSVSYEHYYVQFKLHPGNTFNRDDSLFRFTSTIPTQYLFSFIRICVSKTSQHLPTPRFYKYKPKSVLLLVWHKVGLLIWWPPVIE